jgi:hypothetical protein
LTTSAVYENLSITEADIDWYYFDLPASNGGQVTLSFTHDLGDLQLELFDAQKQLLQQSNSSTSNDGAEIINLNAGTEVTRYFLKVSGVDAEVVQSNYSLKVEPTSSVTRSQATADTQTVVTDDFDSNGHNNIPDKATNIGSLGNNELRSVTGLTITQGDKDWFVYDPSRITTLNPNTITISGYTGDLTLTAYTPEILTNPDAEPLATSARSGASTQSVGFGSVNTPVYVRVESDDPLTATDYELNIARRNFDIDGNGTVSVSDIQLAFVNKSFGSELIDDLNKTYGFVQNGATRTAGEDISGYLDTNAQETMLDANFDGISDVKDIQLAFIFYTMGQGNPDIANSFFDELNKSYGFFDSTKTNGTEIAQYINLFNPNSVF